MQVLFNCSLLLVQMLHTRTNSAPPFLKRLLTGMMLSLPFYVLQVHLNKNYTFSDQCSGEPHSGATRGELFEALIRAPLARRLKRQQG